MKLWLWKNSSSESDFFDGKNINMPESSDAHSGGIVVLAETIEEALELIKKYTSEPLEYNAEMMGSCDWQTAVPVEISLNKKGVVIYASGDC